MEDLSQTLSLSDIVVQINLKKGNITDILNRWVEQRREY